jgi:hypothetical protein
MKGMSRAADGGDTKHTRTGRETSARFNLEGITRRSEGGRRRTGDFSAEAVRKKEEGKCGSGMTSTCRRGGGGGPTRSWGVLWPTPT